MYVLLEEEGPAAAAVAVEEADMLIETGKYARQQSPTGDGRHYCTVTPEALESQKVTMDGPCTRNESNLAQKQGSSQSENKAESRHQGDVPHTAK